MLKEIEITERKILIEINDDGCIVIPKRIVDKMFGFHFENRKKKPDNDDFCIIEGLHGHHHDGVGGWIEIRPMNHTEREIFEKI